MNSGLYRIIFSIKSVPLAQQIIHQNYSLLIITMGNHSSDYCHEPILLKCWWNPPPPKHSCIIIQMSNFATLSNIYCVIYLKKIPSKLFTYSWQLGLHLCTFTPTAMYVKCSHTDKNHKQQHIKHGFVTFSQQVNEPTEEQELCITADSQSWSKTPGLNCWMYFFVSQMETWKHIYGHNITQPPQLYRWFTEHVPDMEYQRQTFNKYTSTPWRSIIYMTSISWW